MICRTSHICHTFIFGRHNNPVVRRTITKQTNKQKYTFFLKSKKWKEEMYGRKTEELLNFGFDGMLVSLPFLSMILLLSWIHPPKAATTLKPSTTLRIKGEMEKRGRSSNNLLLYLNWTDLFKSTLWREIIRYLKLEDLDGNTFFTELALQSWTCYLKCFPL